MNKEILDFFNGKAVEDVANEPTTVESIEKMEYVEVWKKASLNTSGFCPDVECAWSSVKQKLKKKTKVRSLAPLYWAAAACAIFAFGLYSLIQSDAFSVEAPAEVVERASEQVREVSLPDGSKVWLNSGAEISYLQKQPRSVTLKGEAFFVAASDASNPFTVLAGELKITVLGTEFNVSSSEYKASVQVVEGKVKAEAFSKDILLVKGQQLLVNPTQRIVQSTEILSYNFLSWKTGELVFSNTEMPVVIADMQRHFGVEISLENPQISRCTLSLVLKDASLQESLEIVASLLGGKVSENRGKFMLSGMPCDITN